MQCSEPPKASVGDFFQQINNRDAVMRNHKGRGTRIIGNDHWY